MGGSYPPPYRREEKQTGGSNVIFGPVMAFFALGAAAVAAYTDLTENIVPNALTFPLIALGVLAHLALGVYRSDFLFAVSGLIGAAVGFSVTYLLYLFGGFGGGDIKLMAALGAILPFSPSFFASPSHIFTAVPLFPVSILIDGLLLSSPFLIGYSTLCFLRGEDISAKRLPIPRLEPKMVPAEAVWESEGEVKKDSSLPKNHDRCYADPHDTQGLQDQQVESLVKLWKEGKIDSSLKIKRTFPFAPVITVGVFSAVFFGNLYWAILATL